MTTERSWLFPSGREVLPPGECGNPRSQRVVHPLSGPQFPHLDHGGQLPLHSLDEVLCLFCAAGLGAGMNWEEEPPSQNNGTVVKYVKEIRRLETHARRRRCRDGMMGLATVHRPVLSER